METTVACTATGCSCGDAVDAISYVRVSAINTLAFDAKKCINCGMCSAVCPHGVFLAGITLPEIARPDACMECGACQRNCPVGAIAVESGVGCAAAMIYAALRGRKEVTCGDQGQACCS